MERLSQKDKAYRTNVQFYNDVADHYDEADGRRKDFRWLHKNLGNFAHMTRGEICVDIGAGTGYISKIANKYFDTVIAIDPSREMLLQIDDPSIETRVRDADRTGLPNNSVDCVVIFAALHHIYDYNAAIKEAHRILKDGGILYTDHDLSIDFSEKWLPLIKLYRLFRNNKKRFQHSLYDASETHPFGISSGMLECYAAKLFKYWNIEYHWRGLFPLPFKGLRSAPLIKLIAVKGAIL